MSTTLPVSDVVTVAISLSPTPPQARAFNSALVLGTSTVLPLYDRVRTYTQLVGGVDADFASNTDEYKAAAAWFGRSAEGVVPPPLKIGRRFTADQAASLRGGQADQTLADWTAITNGGFDININGTNRQISAINFSAATSLTDVAADLQTALQAVLSSTTCTYDATRKRFVITSPTTGTASTIGYAVPPTHSGGPFTDISTMMAATVTSGAQTTQGIAAENVTAAWTASAAFDAGWYGMIITGTTVQDSKDSMAFAEVGGYFFMDATADINCTDPTSTTDLAYYCHNQGYNNSAVFFDNANSDKFICASALCKMLAVDYTQPNSVLTLKFKLAPGYAPVSVNETQRAALNGKKCNYYALFGNVPMFAEGTVGVGRFIDEVIGLASLQAGVQNAVFTALYTNPTKVPQTDAGSVQLTGPIDQVLDQYRVNGFLAAGIWKGPPIGQIATGDFVPNGWYSVASPVSSQSVSDRAARKAPPIQALGIGAGAVHSSAIVFNFQR